MNRSNKLLMGVAVAAALAAAGYYANAKAADLGGTCCQDVDERLAELEATAARKGNRKMALTVYGSVNQAILWVDAPGIDKHTTITNNTNSQGRFGFKGEAKVSADLSAGYLLEVGTAEASDTGSAVYALGVRHSALYLKSATVGSVWLGKTSTATDGVNEISLANVDPASTMLSLEPLSGTRLSGANLIYDGNREEVLKYVTPTFAGFTASAAWFGNKNDAWDVALRYGGEFSGIRLAGGIGYRVEDSNSILRDKVKTIGWSASVMHVLTGLFVNGSYGKITGSAISGDSMSVVFPFQDSKAMHFQGGVERKWIDLGKTTLFAEWGQQKQLPGFDTGRLYGAGVVQSVDAAAMDLYLAYRNYDKFEDAETREKFGVQTIVGGAVIRF